MGIRWEEARLSSGREHERMEILIRALSLPHTTIDVSENNVDAAVGKSADGLQRTGALHISN